MSRLNFDIKYRPQIESGEYKVVTGDGRPVKIVCWDKKVFGGRFEIVGLVPTHQGDTETVQLYCPDGTHIASSCRENFKLFIITPGPELSEFEKAVGLEIFDEPFEERHIKVIKEESAKLLALARKQLIKDGYVIEKKAFHDAVEKVAPEVMKEVSDKVDMEEALRLGYEKGRADALKDLPRWRKWENGACGNGRGIPLAIVKRGLNGYELVDALGIQGEQYIILSDLEKLPGFNEDEK